MRAIADKSRASLEDLFTTNGIITIPIRAGSEDRILCRYDYLGVNISTELTDYIDTCAKKYVKDDTQKIQLIFYGSDFVTSRSDAVRRYLHTEYEFRWTECTKRAARLLVELLLCAAILLVLAAAAAFSPRPWATGLFCAAFGVCLIKAVVCVRQIAENEKSKKIYAFLRDSIINFKKINITPKVKPEGINASNID